MYNLKIFNGKCLSKYLQYQKISLVANENTIKFIVVLQYFNEEILEREFVFDLAAYQGKVVQLNLHSDTTPLNLRAMTMLEYVERNSLASTLSNSLENERSIFGLCRLVFDEDIYISFFDDVSEVIEISGTTSECLHIANGKTITGALIEQSVVFAKQYDKFIHKAKMISTIDHYNSIAYLECQLDALTRVVKQILPSVTTDVPQSLLDILNTADRLSVLNIKNSDKVLSEFDNKQYVRTLQQEYYNEKSID